MIKHAALRRDRLNRDGFVTQSNHWKRGSLGILAVFLLQHRLQVSAQNNQETALAVNGNLHVAQLSLRDLSIALMDIEVTSIATGTPTPVSKSASVVSVITAKQIGALGFQHLDDILATSISNSVPLGNPDLEPETLDAIELACTQQFNGGSFTSRLTHALGPATPFSNPFIPGDFPQARRAIYGELSWQF